ncbi:MAG: PAS domain-containing sensor histidine kinase [Prevotella sp.]|nr:PAS domain-containing sensor histidine kinase [Prevotella sp.]
MMNILLDITKYHYDTGADGISLLLFTLTLLAFIVSLAINQISLLRIRKHSERAKDLTTIMQHTLNTSRNYVIRLSIRDQLGFNMHGDFLPESGMSYQDSFEYIHPDDRAKYKEFVYSLINGKLTGDCTFRWDASREKHKGEWRIIHDLGIGEYTNPNQKQPINIFCTLTDMTDQIEMENQENELTNRYRKIFEQGLIGLAFYDKTGHLLTANQKMREILKFQSEDDPYYFNRTLYDMPSFRDVLYEHRPEELYFCAKSIIPDRGVNCYTEIRVHPIYDEHEELVYITFSIRDITQERELHLQNKKSDEIIRHTNEEIQRYETELQYLMDNVNMRFFRTSFKKQEVTIFKSMSQPESNMDFKTLFAHFIDNPYAEAMKDPYNAFSKSMSSLCLMHPLFHKENELEWNQIDVVPDYENGQLTGTFGIIRNVSDLIEKQERLKEETERANESGMKKSTFMANMTHEIRTPLNAIVGFSDVLSMLSTPEEKQEIIRVIMNNCDMLLRLVNDILAISSLDNVGIDIFPKETDFAKDFNDTAKAMAQRVLAPVEFIVESPYTSFHTVIDSGRIQQVITNFVTNAVKYTHEGHIKIGYHTEERQGRNGLYFYCEDTGTGIPKESQAKVFDRFVKLNDYVQGTGLGLSICKAIADKCEGEIGLFSEGEGHGSTFWLWIPCEEIKKEN